MTYESNYLVTFLRRIFKIISAFLIFAFIFVMCFLLIPHNPIIRVETLTLKNFDINLSNPIIYGNWDTRLIVRNPNPKVTLYYEELKANLFYKSDSVSETSLPLFVQGTMNETNLKATFSSLMAYVKNWGDIIQERNNGMVEFSLKIRIRVRFKGASWRAITRRVADVDVDCPGLSIGIPANSNGGFLLRGSKQCREIHQ